MLIFSLISYQRLTSFWQAGIFTFLWKKKGHPLCSHHLSTGMLRWDPSKPSCLQGVINSSVSWEVRFSNPLVIFLALLQTLSSQYPSLAWYVLHNRLSEFYRLEWPLLMKTFIVVTSNPIFNYIKLQKMLTVAHLNQWILGSSKELWEDRLCFKGNSKPCHL